MKKDQNTTHGAEGLQKKAERLLKKKDVRGLPDTDEGTRRLLHELQVHQVELEMQNEALRLARDEIEAGLVRYTDLYDFAPAGYFSLSRDSTIFQVNLTGASLLGMESSRLMNRRFDAFVAKESRPAFRTFLDEVFAGQDKHSCEILILREEEPIDVRIEAVAALSGEECRAVVIDITERKKLEASLQESKERYKELVANANSAILRMDQQGTITFFNHYAQKLFGYDLGEILGKNARILLPPIESSGRNLETMMDAVLRNPDEFDENVNENIKKNGDLIWVSWRNKAMRDSSGKIIGNLAIGVDITAHKRAEQALNISETRYRRLFETAQEGTLILDADTGHILEVNPFLVEMLGYSHEDYLGKKLWESGAFRNMEAGKVDFTELQNRGYVRYDDLPLQTKDGRSIVVEFVCNVYPVDSHKVIQCNIRDITERKHMSEALQKSHSELERRVEARTVELRAALAEIQIMKDQLEAENIYFRQERKMRHQFENIIGQSDGLKYVLYRAEQVASTNTTVLILGETGTGKELIAAAIHDLSPRRDRPLITVNCAALPASLMESELFGREKGAFTGADTRQVGRFEVANGSTLCLDEIGELPLELQAKLLRVIQNNEFERLGSSRTIKVDVRISSNDQPKTGG